MPRLAVVCLLLAGPASAQEPGGPESSAGSLAPALPATVTRDADGRVTVRAVRVARPIVLDGVLDEDVYRELQPIDGFIQQEPKEG